MSYQFIKLLVLLFKLFKLTAARQCFTVKQCWNMQLAIFF